MSGGVCTETKKDMVAALRNHLARVNPGTTHSRTPSTAPVAREQKHFLRVPGQWVPHVHDLQPLEGKASSPCCRSSGKVLKRTHLTTSLDKELQQG